MEIIKLTIDDITPYEKNAKIHTQEQIDQIVNSIKQFGMNDPIGIWGKKNIIVEGHGRLEALKQIGYKDVECIRLDHLTDEERKAYTLAHNKLTLNTDFDFSLLEEELSGICEIDMGEFGFDIITGDNFGDDFELPNEDKPQARTITLTLSEKQHDITLACIDYINSNEISGHEFGNLNKKSNALFEVIHEWAEQKTLS